MTPRCKFSLFFLFLAITSFYCDACWWTRARRTPINQEITRDYILRQTAPQSYDFRFWTTVLESRSKSYAGETRIKFSLKSNTRKLGLAVADDNYKIDYVKVFSVSSVTEYQRTYLEWWKGKNDTAEVNFVSSTYVELKCHTDLADHRNYTLQVHYKGKITEGKDDGINMFDYDADGWKWWFVNANLGNDNARHVSPTFCTKAVNDTCVQGIDPDAETKVNLEFHHDCRYKVVAPGYNREVHEAGKFVGTHNIPIHEVTFVMAKFAVASKTFYLTEGIDFKFSVFYRYGKTASVALARIKTDGWSEFTLAQDMFLAVGNMLKDSKRPNIVFPHLKMDIVLLPHVPDQAQDGASLSIFKEDYFFWFEERSIGMQHQILLKIADKMTEQYLGLSMDTHPKDKWVMKGLVNYLKYKVVAAVRPNFPAKELMEIEQVRAAFVDDAWSVSTALCKGKKDNSCQKDVQDFSAAASKFASILGMYEEYIGHEPFLHALSQYYKANGIHSKVSVFRLMVLIENAAQNQNATSKLDKKIPFTTSFSNWFLKPGYPVVKVTWTDNQINVTQTRFGYNNVTDTTPWQKQQHPHWLFPIWITNRTEFITNGTQLLEKRAAGVMVNQNKSVFYRVNYDESHWEQIIFNLKQFHGLYNPLTRAHLIDDALNLAHANLLEYRMAFELTKYLTQERHFLPWTVAWMNFKRLLQNTSDDPTLKKLLRSLIKPIKKEIQPYTHNPTDDMNMILLKNIIMDIDSYNLPSDETENIEHLILENSMFEMDRHFRDAYCCNSLRRGKNSQVCTKYLEFYSRKNGWPVPFEKEFYAKCCACYRGRTDIVLYSIADYAPYKHIPYEDKVNLRKYFIENADYKGLYQGLVDVVVTNVNKRHTAKSFKLIKDWTKELGSIVNEAAKTRYQAMHSENRDLFTEDEFENIWQRIVVNSNWYNANSVRFAQGIGMATSPADHRNI